MTPAPGNVIGDAVGGVLGSAADGFMQSVWEATTGLMTSALSVVDSFSTFTVDAHSGPVGAIWPTLLTVSTAIALGLFFWQLTLAVLRGGKGMMRVATGPVAYGAALALTVTAIAAVLGAADELTTVILSQGLKVTNFAGAFTHTSVLGQVGNEVKAVALGLIGIFGVLPAALGWVLEIIWRQAAILVLVATVPITAAGLLAQGTASWFWRGLRWSIAAITVKPVLALIVVIGMSSLANATGPAGLLAGVAVLWVSLASPLALFKLLAFVEPGTDSGQTFRESFSQLSSRFSGGSAAGDSPAGGSGSAGGGSGADPGGMGAFESANTARFDAAGSGPGAGAPDALSPAGISDGAAPGTSTSGSAGGSGATPTNESTSGTAADPAASWGTSAAASTGSAAGPDNGSTYTGGADSGVAEGGTAGVGESPVPAVAAPPSDSGPAHPSPYPRPPAGGGGGASSGSGGVAAGEEVAEAAVIL